jgi:excisionase family DNA binding protein
LREKDNKNLLDEEEFLTSKEVADLFRISSRMAQILAQEGDLPAVRIGKRWRYPTNQIKLVKEGKWQKEASTDGKGQKPGGSDTGTPTDGLYENLLGQK